MDVRTNRVVVGRQEKMIDRCQRRCRLCVAWIVAFLATLAVALHSLARSQWPVTIINTIVIVAIGVAFSRQRQFEKGTPSRPIIARSTVFCTIFSPWAFKFLIVTHYIHPIYSVDYYHFDIFCDFFVCMTIYTDFCYMVHSMIYYKPQMATVTELPFRVSSNVPMTTVLVDPRRGRTTVTVVVNPADADTPPTTKSKLFSPE